MRRDQAVSAGDILREYAAVTGWDAASMLAVALDYIDLLESIEPPQSTAALGGGGAFRAFVHQRATEEVAMADD